MEGQSLIRGMKFKNKGNMIVVRKDSPLIIGVGENENFIASDVPAILQYTRKYYLLEENEIATIKADRVEFCDIIGAIIPLYETVGVVPL